MGDVRSFPDAVLWVCSQTRRLFLIHRFVKRASCSHIRRRLCVRTFPLVYVVMFVFFHSLLSRSFGYYDRDCVKWPRLSRVNQVPSISLLASKLNSATQ